MDTLPQAASLSSMVMAGATLDEIARFLDGLDHAGRLAQVMGSPRSIQGKLFALAGDAPPLSLEDFVPAGVPAGRPVEVLVSSRDVIHAFWVPPLASVALVAPERSVVLSSHQKGCAGVDCAFCRLKQRSPNSWQTINSGKS